MKNYFIIEKKIWKYCINKFRFFLIYYNYYVKNKIKLLKNHKNILLYIYFLFIFKFSF